MTGRLTLRLFLALTLTLGWIWSCAGRRTALSGMMPSGSVAAGAADHHARADKLWLKRDDPQTAWQALNAYEKAFAADPTNPDVGARLARAFAFVGEYVATSPGVRDTLFARGLAAGERTLELNEKFRRSYQRYKDEERALATLDRQWVPAIYWTCANLEKWLAGKSWLVRLGNKRRLELYRRRILALDEGYYYGGGYRLGGKLKLDPPQESLPDDKTSFLKAINLAPNFFANRRVYAQVYAVAHKDRALFREQLEDIINGDPKVLAEAYPENKYEQEIARQLLARVDEFFKVKEARKRDFKPRY